MTNECIVCYSDSAKSICSTCNVCTCITCYKKLTHCPQCRNELKLLPTKEDLEFISSTIDSLEEDPNFMHLWLKMQYGEDVINQLTQDQLNEINIIFSRLRLKFLKKLREQYAAMESEVGNEN